MGAFFTAILAKITGFAAWIIGLVKAVFLAGWLILTDVGCWAFEGCLEILQSILEGLPGTDAFSALNPASYISGAPAELINMMGLMRIGEALAIILAAIAIKLVLQVIPFTRLGS